MKTCVVLFLLAASLAYAADRVVLLEDFTNCGCGPCWNFEPTLNGFISDNFSDLSVVRPHVWWPTASDPIYVANPSEQEARVDMYTVNAVPWIQFDGVIHATNSQSGLENAFNTRMAVPCYLSIDVAKTATNDTGTLHITLVAEQDLGDTDLRLHCILVENDVPGEGYWAGSYFEQAFRDNLCGANGQSVTFGSPYPDTVEVDVPYGTQGWVVENLYLSVFVQNHTGSTKEVMNAWFRKFDDITGIEDECWTGLEPAVGLDVFPNPSSGTFTVVPRFPGGRPATVSVYDVYGRLVADVELGNGVHGSVELEQSGAYFLRLDVDGSPLACRRISVIR